MPWEPWFWSAHWPCDADKVPDQVLFAIIDEVVCQRPQEDRKLSVLNRLGLCISSSEVHAKAYTLEPTGLVARIK